MFNLIRAVYAAMSVQDREEVLCEPTFWWVMANKSENVLGAFYWLYTHTSIKDRTPLMKDPAFLIQLDEAFGKEWEACGRGSIWQMAGVQRHAYFNGHLRPVVELNLSDLRKAIKNS